MIQFNLLPDVKLEFIKAQRLKRVVVSISFAVTAVTLGIFILLFFVVNFAQKRHISNLNKDIEESIAHLQSIPDIDKVLTIQNQLGSLTTLHEAKPAASRTLTYLSQLTPAKASISQTTTNFDTGTISIVGSADSLVTVNKFADTLKFTTFTTSTNQEAQNAFSEVVLTSFGVDTDGASYQLDLKYNPEIFNNTVEVKLVVPDIISTRSQTEKPSALFQKSEEDHNMEESN